MKKTTVFFAAAALCGAAFAAQNDALVSFSSKGPDAYADGTTVLDGECYALVWMANGASGLSVAADGSATGGEIVLAAPVAKGGRCPKVVFEVDAGDMKTKYQGGSWGVYLLDTRRWGADGAAKPAGTVNGKVRLVNAAGAVPGAAVSVASGASGSVGAVTGAAVASGATARLSKAEFVDLASLTVDIDADGAGALKVDGVFHAPATFALTVNVGVPSRRVGGRTFKLIDADGIADAANVADWTVSVAGASSEYRIFIDADGDVAIEFRKKGSMLILW